MRRFLTIIAIVTLMALAVAGTAGCGCLGERIAEEATEAAIESNTDGEVDVEIDEDGDNGTVTIESEDGDVTITGGEDVPEEYPDDFPLYEGDVTGSSAMTTPEGSMVTVAVMTKDDFDAIKTWVEDELAADGWTILFQTDVADSGMRTAGYNVEKDGRNGTIAVTEEDGGIIVSHTVLTATE